VDKGKKTLNAAKRPQMKVSMASLGQQTIRDQNSSTKLGGNPKTTARAQFPLCDQRKPKAEEKKK
jgi:hypothetical protein